MNARTQSLTLQLGASKRSQTQGKDEMTLKTLATMICVAGFLSGCGQATDPAARFSDVARNPPLSRPATIEYLITYDRPLAEWIEEMARACDVYGCV
jgi:hypothetical protein